MEIGGAFEGGGEGPAADGGLEDGVDALAVPGDAGRVELVEERWDRFVVPGLGIRCVQPNDWVTGAETCEFVLALEAADRHEQALEQFTNMQHLREEDGSYWTGLVFADGKRWPVELSTWTGAVVLLAADALSRTTPGNEIFRYVSAHTAQRLRSQPGDPTACVTDETCPTMTSVR